MFQSAQSRRAYLVMIFDGLCASSASVILPLLRENYDIPYQIAGLLLAFLSIGNLASALLCGFLPRWWGVRKTALVFTSGMFLGYLLLSISGLPVFLLLGFLLIGLGKGSSMNHATVITGAEVEDKTKSVNLINALFAVGSLLAPLVYLVSGRIPVWNAPVIALTISGAIVWFMFCTMGIDKSRRAGAQKDDLSFLKDRHFWFTTAFLFGAQCVEISVTGWLVTYFKDQGILSAGLSEWTVTVIWGAMLIGRLLYAFVLPSSSRLRSLFLISCACIVTYSMLLFSSSGIAALVSLFLFGLSISGCYPIAIATANKTLSNASVGVLLPVAGIGAIVMPYITGAVAQEVGIHGGMMCSFAAIGIMLVFSFLMRRSQNT